LVSNVHGKVIIINDDWCNGCLECAVACSIVHTGDIALDRAHIMVCKTGEERFVPLTCHHCETPSCVRACPTKACHQDLESQRVLIDPNRCIGCRSCVTACPFGHAHYDEVARISTKCDYCDGAPECEKICETHAIRYVSADEVSQPAKRGAGLVRAAVRLRGRRATTAGG
jgi:Fe-S-cluster-containing hydrogenase component 2